uniref:hypothetical protein n=1 Tax=Nesterenkonia aerolata TaxID=3074079 RepID=UPI0035B62CAA
MTCQSTVIPCCRASSISAGICSTPSVAEASSTEIWADSAFRCSAFRCSAFPDTACPGSGASSWRNVPSS